MLVYNTLQRRKEEFAPREPGRVSMYVCGVTPYDAMHVGHARTFMAYDVLRRYLESRGLELCHVQNVTDIDDKIIARATHLGEEPVLLAKRFMEEALRDCDSLGLLRAHLYPTVSGHMQEIIEMIEALVGKGAAYLREGSVYFDVSAFPGYGRLSHQNTEEMQSSGRIETDENKADPLDFALWKSAKPGEPCWDSPWGPGRPGWHIECSAMSLKYLNNGFDIHGGAIELQFPHHENEVAQSEAYTGEPPFVRYWLHSGVVFVNGQKMSKSLGNFVTVKDILKVTSAEALRLMFFTTHYRSPFDYSDSKVEESKAAWERVQQSLRLLDRERGDRTGKPVNCEGIEGPLAEQAVRAEARFHQAMEDDFNTPLALATLFELVSESNRYFSENPPPEERRVQAAVALCKLTQLLSVLGFSTSDEGGEEAVDQSADLLNLLVEVRQMARSQKQFALADVIRDRLKDLGYVLEDHAEGTSHRKIS
ncbi:MAG: cysteine--tRNA ligase [Armatimonadetes bacterium]|nr:cysteine--tRNA ligase [Armatimonadota bacterium]